MSERLLYELKKREDGLWYVVDNEGYDAIWIGYETKREAKFSFNVLKEEQAKLGVKIYL